MAMGGCMTRTEWKALRGAQGTEEHMLAVSVTSAPPPVQRVIVWKLDSFIRFYVWDVAPSIPLLVARGADGRSLTHFTSDQCSFHSRR